MGAKRWGDAAERVATENGILVKTHQEYTITDDADLEEIDTDLLMQGSIVYNITEGKLAVWDGESSWVDTNGEEHGGDSMGKVKLIEIGEEQGGHLVFAKGYDEDGYAIPYTFEEMLELYNQGVSLMGTYYSGSSPVVNIDVDAGSSLYFFANVCWIETVDDNPVLHIDNDGVGLDENGYWWEQG